MRKQIAAEEAAGIRAALAGVKPTNPEDWAKASAGDVHFKLPNGWTLVVFNDCDEWDYVSEIFAPDGRQWDPFPSDRDYEQGIDHEHELADWHPSDPTGWGLGEEQERQIEEWNSYPGALHD